MRAAAVPQQGQRAVKFSVCVLRQRQHDVAANFRKARLPRPCQRLRGPGGGVGAAQPAQLRVVGALHAKADAGHACCPEASQRLRCDNIGVGLQRDLRAGQGIGSLDQSRRLRGHQQCRGAAAKVQRVGAAGVFRQFPQQRIHVALRHAARTGG